MAKNNKITAPREVRIPITRFVDDTCVQVNGTIHYADDGYGAVDPDKLDGIYRVSTYGFYDYDAQRRVTSVDLSNILTGEDFGFTDKNDHVTAASFTRVKPRVVRLNDDYDMEVFPGGLVMVDCQYIEPKNAEKAALAILTACGYTFS